MGDETTTNYLENKIEIGVNDFNKLHDAKLFSKLPNVVINYFHNQDIVIDGNATVLKHFSKKEWLLINKSTPFWQFYYLKTGTRFKNTFPLLIRQETPDYNNQQNDPRLRTGISFLEEAPSEGQTFVEESIILNQRQQQKAAYFFKNAANKNPFQHERAIYKFDEWGEAYYKIFTKDIAKVGFFILIGLICILQIPYYFGLPVVAYAAYRFKNIFKNFKKSYQLNDIINKSLDTLKKERELLLAEGNSPVVANAQIEQWLQEEIATLDREAFQAFQIRKEDLIPVDDQIKGKTIGINIEEWGLIQPIATDGKRAIQEKSLRAFRFNGQRPLFGVYYFIFFYLTADAICVHSCFYDFIHSKKYGTSSKKYSYQELLKIEAKVDNSLLHPVLGNLETNQVDFHFIDKKVTVALSDSLTLTNLRARIEGIAPLNTPTEEVEKHITPTKNPELKNLLELHESQLVATRHSLLITSINYFWNLQKRGYYNEIPSAAVPKVQVLRRNRYV